MSRTTEALSPHVYGDLPGHKEPTTSRAAARAIAADVNERQREVMDEMDKVWPAGLTADECAKRIGRDEKAVRPRFTELGPLHFALIEKTGERRANESGLKAAVWRRVSREK